MKQICPGCQAENRPLAKFCEQCGAQLAGSETIEQTTVQPRRTAPVNWAALLALALLIGAVTWVVAMPGKPGDDKTQEAGNPHAEGANPHAEGGNPHGEGGGMGDIGRQLEDGKAALQKDPLDVNALTSLYDLYGQIGMGEKMRPHAEAAVAAWQKANAGQDSPDLQTLAGIALATIRNGDHGGALVAMQAYHEADPENIGVVATLGNLEFELNRKAAREGDIAGARQHAEQSVAWYDQYLAKSTAGKGDEYWNARIDQASMRLELSDASGKSEAYQRALDSLLEVTQQAPENWGGWHNLGLAYKLTEQKEQALEALRKAESLAGNDLTRWESQKEIALLEGKPVPPSPAPADPHEGVDMPKTAPGTPNPHGEGFNPHAEGGFNPHAEGNPHGESGS